MIEVTKLAGLGPFDNNAYVLSSGRDAIIVDGANDAPVIIDAVKGLDVTCIVETHHHQDHWQAVDELVRALGAPVLAHPDDTFPFETRPLTGGALTLGNDEVRVIHTPGHTPGSLCFLTGDRLISGDTLFPGGPGNTFNDPVAFETIMRSVDALFAMLGDDVIVHPGHGADTTIGAERASVEEWRARGW
jgi:glyoxylase-like metal-dependent hydrolase (beta-lactamase superfamily II)